MDEQAEVLSLPQRPKRVILEIGPGRLPFPAWRIKRRLTDGEVYIGVESDPERTRQASKFLSDRGIGKERGFIVQGGGEKLPLGNHSVEEVVVSNVIGDIARGGWGEEGPPRVIRAIAEEVGRVLKVGGKLHVVETLSPSRTTQPIIDLFRNVGLLHMSTLRAGTARDKIEQFAIELGRDAFLLEFERPFDTKATPQV